MESKPSAVPLEMLCEAAGVDPQDCIVVGDTISDTGMARNAHAALCIGVLSGSGAASQLVETGANILLPHVGDIPALLESMGMTMVRIDDATTEQMTIDSDSINVTLEPIIPRIQAQKMYA